MVSCKFSLKPIHWFLPSCIHRMRKTCIQHPGRTKLQVLAAVSNQARALRFAAEDGTRDEAKLAVAVSLLFPPWDTTSPGFVECLWHMFFFWENFRDPYFTWWRDLVKRLDCLTHPACATWPAAIWGCLQIGYPRTIMVRYFIFFRSQNCHANWAHNSINFLWDNLIFPILLIHNSYQFISHYAMSPWWLLET